MARIFKYELVPEERQIVRMPRGAKILHIGVQETDFLCIWAEVDPEAPEETRTFRIVTTGETFDAGPLNYIGTFFAGEDGWFVGHLYEQVEGISSDPDANDHRASADLGELRRAERDHAPQALAA